MLKTYLYERLSPNAADGSSEGRKATAETEQSNSQKMKQSLENNNFQQVEDWVERQERLDLSDVVQASIQLCPRRIHFNLPPRNYTNKWAPNFELVYHQYPPKSNHKEIFFNRNDTFDNISQELSYNWGKSIDTEFSSILIGDPSSKCYQSPTPYGFDVERSRIIVGDRKIIDMIDCSFKEFVTRLHAQEKHEDPQQFKGIKLTCLKRPNK